MLIERVLKRHGFWLAKKGPRVMYVTHNEAYGGLYVTVERDPEMPWRYRVTLEVKELDKKFEFSSARRLEEFLKRIEMNTAIFGFRPGLPTELLKKELEEAYTKA